jgi:glucoamylase
VRAISSIGCSMVVSGGCRSDELGEEPPPIFERRLRYPTRAVRSVDREDARVDSSLLGLAWPFRAVDPMSPRMRATVASIERELRVDDGGILRHEGDDYAGGHPWLISTIWLGLAQRQAGDATAHRRAIQYVLARRTPLDLLPEQVTESGEPAWVVPLGWSHAMLILAARPELAIACGDD